ncbi:MAG: linear amide C-N hydrolase [Vulcanococcus sp.]
MLKGSDGDRVYGRTMEFGQPLNSQAVLIQRGTPLRGNGPDGTIGNGLAWTSRYAVVGLNVLGLKDIVPDGMNEKGLAGGFLYFAGYAKFQAVPSGQTQRSIDSAQLLTDVLTNFATVDEMKRGLSKILVNGASVPAFGGLHGLPGDCLATSRFIRALILSRFAPTNLTTQHQVGTVSRIVGHLIDRPAVFCCRPVVPSVVPSVAPALSPPIDHRVERGGGSEKPGVRRPDGRQPRPAQSQR